MTTSGNAEAKGPGADDDDAEISQSSSDSNVPTTTTTPDENGGRDEDGDNDDKGEIVDDDNEEEEEHADDESESEYEDDVEEEGSGSEYETDDESDEEEEETESEEDESEEEEEADVEEEEVEEDEEDEDEDEDDEDDDDEEEGPTTISERRSLLALAAEHDRVDILKSVLQGEEEDDEEGDGLVELLLNNRRSPRISGTDADTKPAPALAAENGEVDKRKGAEEVVEEKETDEAKQPMKAPVGHHMAVVFIPPLHIAISHGSTHATSCLLRMGSDPSIRPSVPLNYQPPPEEGGDDKSRDGRYRRKYDGMSAWELAFGCSEEDEEKGAEEEEHEEEEEPSSGGWFGFSSSKKKKADKSPNTAAELPQPNRKRRKKSPLNILPSKLEGIRHAFTAEALRSIGSDEVFRLRELLDSGMSPNIEIGGRDLSGWCGEMGALECGKMLRERLGPEVQKNEKDEEEEKEEEEQPSVAETAAVEKEEQGMQQSPSSSESVPSVGMTNGHAPTTADVTSELQSIPSLRNKLEETESLASALSLCLDNLAEEVSVCRGLLLSNGGSSTSLASHVRTLKNLRSKQEEELRHWKDEWRVKENDLIYLAGRCGEFRRVDLATEEREWKREEVNGGATSEDGGVEKEEDGGEERKRREIMAHLVASENKVRKLRASISDLAEENAKNLSQVEERGLSGGINLVRTLREEIRLVEFELAQVKAEEAGCRAKIVILKKKLERQERQRQEKDKARAALGGDVQARSLGRSRGIDIGMQEEAPVGRTASTTINGSVRRTRAGAVVPEPSAEEVNGDIGPVSRFAPPSRTRAVPGAARSVPTPETTERGGVAPGSATESFASVASAEVPPTTTPARDENEEENGLTFEAGAEQDERQRDVPPFTAGREDGEEDGGDASEAVAPSSANVRSRGLDFLEEDEASSAAPSSTNVRSRSLDLFGEDEAPSPSRSIATGSSSSITIRNPGPQGFLPLDLWDILCRIVGFGKDTVRRSAANLRGQDDSNVMIV